MLAISRPLLPRCYPSGTSSRALATPFPLRIRRPLSVCTPGPVTATHSAPGEAARQETAQRAPAYDTPERAPGPASSNVLIPPQPKHVADAIGTTGYPVIPLTFALSTGRQK